MGQICECTVRSLCPLNDRFGSSNIDRISFSGFDARTFKVMTEMIERDPSVPLTLAPQIEYREQVGFLVKICSFRSVS